MRCRSSVSPRFPLDCAYLRLTVHPSANESLRTSLSTSSSCIPTSMHKLLSLCRTEVDMEKYGTLVLKDLLWSEAFRSCTQPRKLAETPVLIDWSSHCTVLHCFPLKVMQFPNFGAHAQEPWCWLFIWYVPGDDLKWHPGHLSCSVEPPLAVCVKNLKWRRL